jgi:hypothetical protein
MSMQQKRLIQTIQSKSGRQTCEMFILNDSEVQIDDENTEPDKPDKWHFEGYQ